MSGKETLAILIGVAIFAVMAFVVFIWIIINAPATGRIVVLG
jgi:hypothetical protein